MEKKTQQCTKKKIPKEIHMFFIFFRISWPQYMIKSVRNFFFRFKTMWRMLLIQMKEIYSIAIFFFFLFCSDFIWIFA